MEVAERNLQHVHGRIARACAACGRPVRSVTLLAVSKTFPAEAVRKMHAAGQRDFGENYVQEGLAKIEALADLRGDLQWHLIGPLQSNKTRPVAEAFDWVHSVDRLKIAERLAAQRPAHLPPLQVCLQVNIDEEASKSGLSLQALPEVAQAVAALPAQSLRLRGLMTIGAPSDDSAARRRTFATLARALGALQAQGLALDTLSMGMSADLEDAVAEGSTLLRVGTALFGGR